MELTRRAALLGGALFTLAACSSLPDGVPDVATGRILSGAFASRYRHTDVGWSVAFPPGHQPGRGRDLPVLVFLHTRGGDHDLAFGGGLHLDKYLADAVKHGCRPYA